MKKIFKNNLFKFIIIISGILLFFMLSSIIGYKVITSNRISYETVKIGKLTNVKYDDVKLDLESKGITSDLIDKSLNVNIEKLHVNIYSADATIINNSVEAYIKTKYSDSPVADKLFMKLSNNKNVNIDDIYYPTYKVYENKKVISIVITYSKLAFERGNIIIDAVKTFNISKLTGKFISNKEVLKMFGLKEINNAKTALYLADFMAGKGGQTTATNKVYIPINEADINNYRLAIKDDNTLYIYYDYEDDYRSLDWDNVSCIYNKKTETFSKWNW